MYDVTLVHCVDEKEIITLCLRFVTSNLFDSSFMTSQTDYNIMVIDDVSCSCAGRRRLGTGCCPPAVWRHWEWGVTSRCFRGGNSPDTRLPIGRSRSSVTWWYPTCRHLWKWNHYNILMLCICIIIYVLVVT